VFFFFFLVKKKLWTLSLYILIGTVVSDIILAYDIMCSSTKILR
jgi:hypothetical protein